MIKKKKRKFNRKRKNVKQEPLHWKPGRDKIVKLGLEPFLHRIDDVIDPNPFQGQSSIPQQQYIATYDTIFTMCIQTEPHNYSQKLYALHGEILSQYFIKNMKNHLNLPIEYSKICFQKWLDLYQKCMWSIDGFTRTFMYLDRFYVPNNHELDNTSLKGTKLFFKHIFNIKFPLIRNRLIKCINLCRNDFMNGNYLFCDEYRWLIVDCVQTVRALHNRLFGISFDGKKTELLVCGYVREFEQNINIIKFIVPIEIIEILIEFRGVMTWNIFEGYFYKYFLNDSVRFYFIKAMQWRNDSKLGNTQYLIKCERVIEYEMNQLKNWTVSSQNKLKIKTMLCDIFYKAIKL